MEDLKLYSVDNAYIDYLRSSVSEHIFSNEGPFYRHSRKYLGVVLDVSGYKYYVPLSSPKKSDYLIKEDGSQEIRKSIVPIMRLIECDRFGRAKLLGTLKFNSMIPVPDECLSLYDLEAEKDDSYKDLIKKEMRVINRNTPKILKSASVIYKQKAGNLKIKYLASTLDFKALERAYDLYVSGSMRGA